MKTSGFTLIEFIIYIAIVSGVIVSLVLYSITISDSREKAFVVHSVQSGGRMALTSISQTIRETNGVNTGESIFDIDPGYVSLSHASSTKNPTIIGLSADNGILEIKEGTSASSTIVSSQLNVTNLHFGRLTDTGEQEVLKIFLTIEFNNNTGSPIYTYSEDFETTVRIRN